MSYILLTYTLSITWILIAFVKYKQHKSLTSPPEKISIHAALIVKPLLFTSLAWGLNVLLGGQAGLWLVGGTHLIIALYCISYIYLYNKKQSSLMSEHI